MKKTAIAIAVALAGFATVAQAAPKDNTWYAGGKLGYPSIMIPVSTVTVSKTTTVLFIRIRSVLVLMVVTRSISMLALKWVMTG